MEEGKEAMWVNFNWEPAPRGNHLNDLYLVPSAVHPAAWVLLVCNNVMAQKDEQHLSFVPMFTSH